ncbi:hypothetical protein CSV69_02370 [Sporosarcina sp. P26b]|nr:hypothetical protein CSV76_00430 [Sporosarcina sp. P17b]PIC97071.1 hypothetical protein CSV69_02370 [Sporosarcina sp. P26b]
MILPLFLTPYNTIGEKSPATLHMKCLCEGTCSRTEPQSLFAHLLLDRLHLIRHLFESSLSILHMMRVTNILYSVATQTSAIQEREEILFIEEVLNWVEKQMLQ